MQSELTAACEQVTGVDITRDCGGQWHSDVMGHMAIDRPLALRFVEGIRRRRLADEFTLLRSRTSAIAKVTLRQAPFGNLWSRDGSATAHPASDSFRADVVDVLRDVVRELAA
jgi:hypothetical protein